jgi:hypothetical protein
MKEKEKKTIEAPVPITTLAELKAVVDTPLTCAFQIDHRPVRLEVRRLNMAVDEQRRAVLRRPVPPFVKDRGLSGDYDLLNPEYRKQKEEAEDIARSLLVYHCCPQVQDGNKGLTDVLAIHGYVKGLLPPMIQELIALTALGGGLNAEVTARANFT